jgi:hypothetical protein
MPDEYVHRTKHSSDFGLRDLHPAEVSASGIRIRDLEIRALIDCVKFLADRNR